MSVANHIVSAAATLGATLTVDEVTAALTEPKNRELGDLAFPVFTLAKALRKAPPAIAAELAAAVREAVAADPAVASVEAVGPYLNFRFDAAARARAVLTAALSPDFGRQQVGAGKRIGIDFSSPNIAKPFGIGHLRSTAIGAALLRLHDALGYEVVAINHLGDWGTQFGKLMSAYERWGDRAQLDADPIQHLYDLYVRFHAEAKTDPALDDEGRAWFKRLEDGDAQATAYWEEFRALSLREFERIYDRLGVTFDHFWGEAYYNELLDAAVAEVEAAGLATISEGALVVALDDLDLPPCLLRKQDGATLYATRDLAAAKYRVETLGLDRLLYVVGAAQSVHFKQVFEVVRRLGYPWADSLVHVPFGMILGISTRKGTLVFLEQILDEGKARVRAHLEEKPELSDAERDEIAEQIAIGAVVFYDLSRNRIKDYDFSWEAMLKGLRPGERGPTGVYLQYTLARLSSVLDRYLEAGAPIPAADAIDFSKLATEAEAAIVAHLERWPAALRDAADVLEAAVVARYALELAELFNTFYSGGHKIVSEDVALTGARVALVASVRNVLDYALRILGVPRPERI
ncbi:MAG: arginine--tRNA ligase [Myxococcales bacterium]|nr:arginine--tRNA ligase [Myxococcales bacterium]MCB9519871.1 arginine--tRNA ligase [Myxococcales bacterium]MCB9532317.1 arginine--tRNA ligase [Myxococcales bacterium]MCB9533222.1 arginine--tRNA ligase [Myxococcales bacterium]